MSEYSEKLKDPRWQKLRLSVFERDEWTCQICFDSESTLMVHHYNYKKGREPWDYDIDDLITLCGGCHESEHKLRQETENELLQALKDKHFMTQELMSLTDGIRRLSFTGFILDIDVSAIALAMSDSKIMKSLIDNYSEFISNEHSEFIKTGKRKEKNNNG